LTANVFDEMGVYWAEIANENHTEAQLKFLKTQLKPDGYILDLACGTGRHTIPLSQQGFGMVGLDVSAKLLKIAKQRSSNIQLVRGDMRFLPFKDDAFSAIISMDTSFGYLPTEQEDKVALAEAKRVLKQRGVFVIDVFNRQRLTLKYKDQQPPKQKEYPSFSLNQKRTISPDRDWLCDFWTVSDMGTGRLVVFEHSVRLYEYGKLRGMLEKAGFAVKDIYGSYEGEKFSPESSRLIIVEQTK